MRRLMCVPAALAAAAGFANAQQSPIEAGDLATAQPALRAGAVRHVIDRAPQIAALPSGELLVMPTQEVWKPVCSNRAPMSVADLSAMAQNHEADFADQGTVRIVNGSTPRAGLDVVYVLGGSVPAAAVPVFANAEAYLQGQFPNDTMTLTVTVSFAALSPGVIGGTSSSYGSASWTDSRAVLQGGADASDGILASLPGGTTIPVRYSTSRTTNEDRIFWTFANWKANGGTVSGNDASMQYSTAFPFDLDPSNGVSSSAISLLDVIIHETGHAMGSTSGVDFRAGDIEAMDIFRFRRTDGSGSNDFNPDTAAEFGVRPRWAVRNNPNDDVNLDNISSEFALSDGSPWQASHFREQVPAIGIMDPAFSYGETFFPNFLRTSDVTLFDNIGWDR